MARASSLGSPMRTSGLRGRPLIVHSRDCHLRCDWMTTVAPPSSECVIRRHAAISGRRHLEIGENPRGLGGRTTALAVLHPALEDGEPDDVDSPAEAELAHPVRLVDLDGLDAETELCGDFLVAVPPCDVAEYFRFAVSDGGLCLADLPTVTSEKPVRDPAGHC